DFEQTAEMVRLANKEGVRFAVADTSRFRPGFSAFREYMQSTNPGQFRVISALSNRPVELSELHDRWLSDPQLAGGGVLLHDCYEMIDQIVLNFGIPEQVYSLNSNHAPDKQQRLSITEDTVVMTMRFSDTLMGNLIASRMFGPAEKLLKIHGNDECLVVTDDSFTVLDNQGNTKSKSRSKIKKGQDQAKMLEAFASSILSPEESEPLAGSNIDLKNMAVIEAGYLSARTGMPEGPSRILDMVKT
ncbi:MAG: Gfo/Idh/MocA family oxidoreductase, partial [Planctomycetes bacterium]|nr:Gfo/Idh/MocA family oxidoreductase [Planctomycetota bacterium]